MTTFVRAGADPVSPVLSEKVGLSTTAQYPWPQGAQHTRWRSDVGEKPHPDLHIFTESGETTVNHKGGWVATVHNGNRTVPLPKKYRKAYRPIIKNFVKKAKKLVKLLGPITFASTFLTERADAAFREAACADEVEWVGSKLTQYVNRELEETQNGYQKWYWHRGGLTEEDIYGDVIRR